MEKEIELKFKLRELLRQYRLMTAQMLCRNHLETYIIINDK